MRLPHEFNLIYLWEILKLHTIFLHSVTFNWCCWCDIETQVAVAFWNTLNYSVGRVEIVSMCVVMIASEEVPPVADICITKYQPILELRIVGIMMI